MTSSQHRFHKMHGLGNDFVIINNIDKKQPLNQYDIPSLANRHLGIGFDQLLVLESIKADCAECLIYNADGSEAMQCGNGLRCLARFLHETGLIESDQFCITTKAGTYFVTIKDYEHISVNMGKPIILDGLKSLDGAYSHHAISIVSMGNPHAVVSVDSIKQENILDCADYITALDSFKNGINLGFMQINHPGQIQLRTFERGSGETLACGSNACAAVVAGHHNKWLENNVQVELPHGWLQVSIDPATTEVTLTGPASFVFSGEMPSS